VNVIYHITAKLHSDADDWNSQQQNCR